MIFMVYMPAPIQLTL